MHAPHQEKQEYRGKVLDIHKDTDSGKTMYKIYWAHDGETTDQALDEYEGLESTEMVACDAAIDCSDIKLEWEKVWYCDAIPTHKS